MSTSRIANIRILITFCLCLALIALAIINFPNPSRAKQQSGQSSTASKKKLRPRYVPGQVLVRYRSESMAQAKTGRLVIATREGELVSDVQRRKGSDLIKGFRLMR